MCRELLEAQMASRRAESDSALLRRQLLELELCRTQLAEAQAQLEEARGAAQLAQSAQQSHSLQRERLEGQLRVAREEVSELQASLQETSAERDALLSVRVELEARTGRAEEDAAGAAAEREAAAARLSRAEAEAASGRELIRSLQRESESGAAARRRLEEEVGEARQQAAFAREDGQRSKVRGDGLAEQLERANGLLDDLKDRLAAGEDARQAAEQALDEVKGSAAAGKEEGRRLQGQVHALQAEVEASRTAEREREAEVAQLKALVSRMDAGRKEMTDKLKANLQALAEAQTAREAAGSQVEDCKAEVAEREGTIAQLRQARRRHLCQWRREKRGAARGRGGEARGGRNGDVTMEMLQ